MSIDNRIVKTDSPKRWIETLQRQLVRENPSALPQHGVDGELGDETKKWVERFQERKGVEVDGVAGPETLSRLREDIIYQSGDSGKGVEFLQEDLMYFTVELANGSDGEYGEGTEQGVKDFQLYNNMTVDGVAGPHTFKKIDELYETILIQSGDEGSHVRRIQKQLNEQEETEISIDVDGDYGGDTVKAVESFQDTMELEIDGVVGPKTMYLLDAENSPLLNDEEMKGELEGLGLDFYNSSDAVHERFSKLFREHPKVSEAVDEQGFENIYTTEMDYPNGSKNNEIIIVVAEVKDKPNLVLSAQFFKENEELKIFSVMDIFGNLPEDDVEIKTYTINDADETSVEEKTKRNVDLEDSLLQSQITFQEAIQESKETNKKLAVINSDGKEVLSSEQGVSIQDWTDIVGITCNIVISVNGNVVGSEIAAAFGLAAGPLGITALITTVIAAVGSYYFCSWLEDQF